MFSLLVPSFVLCWPGEETAEASLSDNGDLIIISPAERGDISQVSQVITCRVGQEQFSAPRLIESYIGKEWNREIIVPQSAMPYKKVQRAIVQKWYAPFQLRALFPQIPWVMRGVHYLLSPLPQKIEGRFAVYDIETGEMREIEKTGKADEKLDGLYFPRPNDYVPPYQIQNERHAVVMIKTAFQKMGEK